MESVITLAFSRAEQAREGVRELQHLSTARDSFGLRPCRHRAGRGRTGFRTRRGGEGSAEGDGRGAA